MSVWTVIVAAGGGTRFGGPKQLATLSGRRVIDHAVMAAAAATDGVIVVAPSGAQWTVAGAMVVAGGATRSESVRAGLAAVPDDAEIVVVHDAARPGADVGLFAAVINAVRVGADGAVPGLPIADTVKRIDATGVVVETVARESLMAVQTPQAFVAKTLRAAHAASPEGTDDAAVVEIAGGRIVVVPGTPRAMKITEPEDLARLEALIEGEESG